MRHIVSVILGALFQTLIGTVKSRQAVFGLAQALQVSNPHRYGQKVSPIPTLPVPFVVSNPHRYGQKRCFVKKRATR